MEAVPDVEVAAMRANLFVTLNVISLDAEDASAAVAGAGSPSASQGAVTRRRSREEAGMD